MEIYGGQSLALSDLFSPHHTILCKQPFNTFFFLNDHESDKTTLQGMTEDEALYCWSLL